MDEEEEEEEGYNSKLNKRGNIDILLMGDLDTSKSQRCIDEFVSIVYTALIRSRFRFRFFVLFCL